MTPDQIIQLLDEFRQLHGAPARKKSKLISIKVPENLLNSFKMRATLAGVPYQTQIKTLMKEWVTQSDSG